MKKTIGMLFVVTLLAIGLIGCTNNEDKSGSDSGDKKELTFWYSLSGENGENFKKIVDDFNEQSDEYHMQAEYQGSYTETLTKIRAVGEDDAPALLMASGTPRKYLAEQDFMVPIQDFIDEDDDFDVDDIHDNVISRYTIDDKLYSMPFSASLATMYYNKDMFEEVGLDPENPPTTYEEMEEAAQTIKDETGNVGFSMATIGYYLEQLLTNQGALYLDNDNGYGGEPTKTLIDEEPGQLVFEWLDRMNQEGTFKNYGSDWEDPRAPFLSGELGMYFDSSANTQEVVQDAPFEVGTAPLPNPEGVDPVGGQVGGNSIYITNKVPEEDREGAYEFLKYLISPEVQAEWASKTGYFPINKKSPEEDVLVETYDEFPQMKTAVDVAEDTPAEPATSGPLSEDGEEHRSIVEAAQEKMYEGEDPIEALNEAAEKINELLE
ncbi:MAG TPA: ABC transporter substrate-binding protein [Virgibacillus sp.]|nr:ABC transporter substrate-binding protein [Virgibacillus sp.]